MWAIFHRDAMGKTVQKANAAEKKKTKHLFESDQYSEALRLCISDTFRCTYLISVHVIHGIQRLFVVTRFKATDVSLSVVGCAPHLK